MKVSAYKSMDGELHESELDCLNADFVIELRGALQSQLCTADKLRPVTTTEVAHIISKSRSGFSEIITRYNRKLNGFAVDGGQGVGRGGQRETLLPAKFQGEMLIPDAVVVELQFVSRRPSDAERKTAGRRFGARLFS